MQVIPPAIPLSQMLWDQKFSSTGFVDDHFKFESDITNTHNMGLQRASELMFTYDLRSALIEDLRGISPQIGEHNASLQVERLAQADAAKERDEMIKKLEKDLKDERDRNLSLNKSLIIKDKELGNLAALRDNWENEREEKDKEISSLKFKQAIMFQDDFDFALAQVKILLPDADHNLLEEAYSLKKIIDGKLE
ncbi:hypothetical protein TSUD_157650 [Trifolium subterraneum]|uniref:Uncharacterized protein n=1 Tax=Trifolium subterraneum TaxID=3900 RepID=A0A2Z6MNN4_TRISU|nr:hypothetical protein TSUD_157650 [Trifolium subterraneum]